MMISSKKCLERKLLPSTFHHFFLSFGSKIWEISYNSFVKREEKILTFRIFLKFSFVKREGKSPEFRKFLFGEQKGYFPKFRKVLFGKQKGKVQGLRKNCLGNKKRKMSDFAKVLFGKQKGELRNPGNLFREQK